MMYYIELQFMNLFLCNLFVDKVLKTIMILLICETSNPFLLESANYLNSYQETLIEPKMMSVVEGSYNQFNPNLGGIHFL